MLKYLTILFLFSLSTFAQINYEVHYKLTYQIDSNDINSRKAERMVLDIGDNYSVFHSHAYSRKDSVDVIIQQIFDSGKINVTYLNSLIGKYKYRIYYDYKLNALHKEDKIINDVYAYIPNFNPIHWQIEQETKKIDGYTAQKATITYGGRKFEAWFTTEIPINDGPYVFKGLPGFVLQVYDIQKYYIFDYIGMQIKPQHRTLAKVESKAKFLEYEKAAYIKKLYREDPAKISQNIAAYTANMPEYMEINRRYAAAHNNPLEKDQ